MKSWKTPTTREIDQAIGLLNQPAQKSYFFDNLKNPAWIGPLYDKGYFKNAPKIKRNEKEGTIQFPIWPESKFLARVVAEANPTILSKIVSEIETDNIRVKEDILEIVTKLPIASVIILYPKVIKYLEDPYLHFGLLPQKIGELIERLSTENKIGDAIKVAQDLLRPIAESQSEEAKKLGLHANPKAKFEIWDYEQILRKRLPALIKADPMAGLDLLVNLLFTAIKVSRGENTDDSDTEDYLYISRRSVREEPQFHSHELESLLISEITSVANSIIKSHPEKFDDVLKLLESKKYNFFKKIILYLLAEYPNLDRNRTASYLKNKDFFDAGWISPEYEYLLTVDFKNLIADDQKIILDWIVAGPDLDAFVNAEKSWTGNVPSADKITGYKEAWQLRHLHVLKDSLSKELEETYTALAAKYPGFDEKIREGVSFALNESPKTKEELLEMSVEQIIDLLQEWKPTGDGFNGKPTKDGLSIVLREIIKERPVEFSNNLEKLHALESTYLFSVLMGLENGLAIDKNINWDKVLDILLNIFITWQKEVASKQKELFDNSVRRQGLSILNAGLRTSGFDIKNREGLWSIIQITLTDPDPTLDREEKTEDEITLAINSIRGEALHSIVEYALWLRRAFEKLPDAKTLIANGFNEMPEVRETLDKYLRLEVEPTEAVRSVYGRYIPWLDLLDPKWVSSNLSKIFSHSEKTHGDGAWDAYITLNQPYDNLLAPLREEYRYRLINADFSEDKKQSLREATDRLAEFITVYYWRNKINLDDDLVKDMVSVADIRFLSHAISFMGRSVYGEKDTPPYIIKKFVEFWDYVVSKISTDPERVSALQGFTWWFASNKFDPTWLLNNLEKTIDLAKAIDSEDFAIDNLVVISKDFPEKVVLLLEKILKIASKPWIAHSSEKEIVEILKNAKSSQSSIAKDAVKRIVNSLAKKELFKFLEVLKES